ncbi:DJ-1/PfpI family protein [Candidatus Cetobacterium colombiensis]|uniref:DJ-1/PfpI family protein n=1 Tax=Candidatus Cetobacterium colombiensis TaxID=3073100 RepID=A0ABU4W7S0_9FUSO|nr:DJ-1/PfpI family protein [Candidatus Cetobacterium colombiensis]MDX8335567.1 DJ-1/PfpI family protein [Candidatus Cetobacterium colombiensis]
MKKILIFASNGFESLELSPFIDIFGWNNIVGNKKIFPTVCAIHNELTATWSLKIIPEVNIRTTPLNFDEYDALIIPGGFGKGGFFNDIQSESMKSLLIHFILNKKIIIGICTGALALGIHGFLENIPATTYLLDNDRYFNQLKKYKAIPIRKDIVIHDNIITSSGPNTAIELAFYLLEKLSNKENCMIVKKNMGFFK